MAVMLNFLPSTSKADVTREASFPAAAVIVEEHDLSGLRERNPIGNKAVTLVDRKPRERLRFPSQSRIRITNADLHLVSSV